jgi:DNA/RNA-binding domain of Phe-tRNA-synthetase-like protein
MSDQDPVDGWVDHELRAEFPALRLLEMTVAARPGRTPRALRITMRELSSRWYGARAVSLRQEPVPQAHRIFFRQIGIDPDADETRTPIERAITNRLVHGDFRSEGLVEDAALVAVVETGVQVWILDDATLDGPLGLRVARHGERLGTGEYANDLPPGRLVVADAERPAAVLFGALAPQCRVTKQTERMRLFAVRVPGVPEMHVEEALWVCAEALQTG